MIEEAVVEQLAHAIHDNYLRDQLDQGATKGSAPALVAWAELDDDLREANRAQARDIVTKVAAVGATVVDAAAAAGPFAFTDAEVEELAREEHARWSAQRTAVGWRYGRTRNNKRKLHPMLTAWEKLPEAEKDKDRDAVRNIPAILAAVGLAVSRTG